MTARTLVVWCPDWPLTAAGISPTEPAATFHANRVVACTAAARAEGVTRGLRRREAQGRCPELRIEAYDPPRDARAFEPVVATVEAFTPRVEITRPGVCALLTRGPSRYFGGDDVLADLIRSAVNAHLPGPCQVGVADGPFAASLAARRDEVIPPGRTPEFLAPLPIGLLDEPELANLLGRLGLRTLGAFAALSADAVVGRFGPVGVVAHRRARGLDDRALDCRVPPPNLHTEITLDPPADRIDTAAFAGKSIADELCATLRAAGLVCTCIRVEAETEHGEQLARIWRHHRAFTPSAIAERVRWQLEGWLAPLASGLTLVRLVPEEVQPDDGRQEGFWGGATEADERAARGLARVQGLLGPEAVVTAVLGGGRGPAEQVRLVPWGEPREPGRGRSPAPASASSAVWPGRLPRPSPAIVSSPPLPAQVVDVDGTPVGVSSRSLLIGTPTRFSMDGGPWEQITAWSGPWTADERWWDPRARRRSARFQMVLHNGAAHLVILERGRWWVEASYD
ncbi:MAG: DNA polymerase Y family protein [Acidimicrobiales bacterium]